MKSVASVWKDMAAQIISEWLENRGNCENTLPQKTQFEDMWKLERFNIALCD